MSSRLHAASSILGDACIRNWPLNLVFHFLNSTVFLPHASRWAYGCFKERHFNAVSWWRDCIKRCIIVFYANRIDGIGYDGSISSWTSITNCYSQWPTWFSMYSEIIRLYWKMPAFLFSHKTAILDCSLRRWAKKYWRQTSYYCELRVIRKSLLSIKLFVDGLEIVEVKE